MDNRNEVSLRDILSAVGGPLEETSLWALLSQSCSLLENELRGTKVQVGIAFSLSRMKKGIHAHSDCYLFRL